jgi:pseudouridine synthase
MLFFLTSAHGKNNGAAEEETQDADRKITLKTAVMTCWPGDMSSPIDAIRTIRAGLVEVLVSQSGGDSSCWKIIRQYGKRMVSPNDKLRRKLSDGRFEIRSVPELPTVIAMYKPSGYIVTKSNENCDVNESDEEKNAKNQPVYDLLTASCLENPTIPPHVLSFLSQFRAVGRLDKDTEGLLLFTNQGRWITALTTPSSHVPKAYRCWLLHPATEADLQSWRNGGILYRHRNSPEGMAPSLPAVSVDWVDSDDRHVMDVTIVEGKYRQVRRCWEALSNKVVRLRRIAFGPISLQHFETEQPGQCRVISDSELHALEMCVSGANVN